MWDRTNWEMLFCDVRLVFNAKSVSSDNRNAFLSQNLNEVLQNLNEILQNLNEMLQNLNEMLQKLQK
jgi:ABC-type transporter Mla subunit MlaD